MPHYTNFGLEARKVMLQKNIKMKELAKELGVSPTYITEIFRGTRPGKKYKGRIAEILGIEMEAAG